MIQWFINLFKSKEPKIPRYLAGDLSKHRIHSTKFEDLCK